MANEATLLYELQPAIPFTVADGAGIEKGAVLKATDPMTAASADGTDDVVAGIAASEKIASDGKTKLGVYRRGIFKMYLSGSCSVGDPLGTIATFTNFVASNKNTANLSGSQVLGTALETGTNGDTIMVELNPQHRS